MYKKFNLAIECFKSCNTNVLEIAVLMLKSPDRCSSHVEKTKKTTKMNL
uniref:Uncharacterized protein n=1 Tax=Arundo donax TaxID=35708 RepID=A0A0A9EPS7_ARUDO